MLRRLFLKDGRLRPVWRVLVYVAAAVVAQIAVSIVVGMAYTLVLGPSALFVRTPVWLDELIAAVSVVGAAVVLRIYLDRRSVASLGITFRPRSDMPEYLRLFALGLAFGAGMQLLGFSIQLALGHSQVAGIQLSSATLRNVLGWTAVFLMAALAEEYPLRGYILQNLWEEWGFWPAAIITAVLFASLHFRNPYFGNLPALTIANIAVDGIWAACAVLWTRSLWLAWGQHFAWNVFEGPVLGTPVSGIQTGPSIVAQVVHGDPLITGGKFGPESSILLPIVEGVGLVVLYLLYKRGVFATAPDRREAYARAAEKEETLALEPGSP